MKIKIIIPVFLLLLFQFATVCECFAMSGKPPGSQAEKVPAHDFVLNDLSGKKVKLSGLRGKVVFLNFFAHWCPPCRAEMPSMQALYNELKGKNFEMVAVAVDSTSKKEAEKLAGDGGYTFKVLLDADGSVSEKYGVRSIPVTYILDKKGNIVFKEIGSRDWSRKEVVKELKGLMK